MKILNCNDVINYHKDAINRHKDAINRRLYNNQSFRRDGGLSRLLP
ncbi:MAG: hypothetical protein V7K15_06540 [Nostoc sp.]